MHPSVHRLVWQYIYILASHCGGFGYLELLEVTAQRGLCEEIALLAQFTQEVCLAPYLLG